MTPISYVPTSGKRLGRVSGHLHSQSEMITNGYLEPIRITLVNLEYDRRNRDDGKEANTGANAEQQNDDGFSNIRRVVGGDTAVIARA